MISIYNNKQITWVDLENPNKEEIFSLEKKFKITVPHPIVEELLSPTLRSKADVYNNLIYLVLHFPLIKYNHEKGSEIEVDFIIGKNFLVTTHYQFVPVIHETMKALEMNSVLNRKSEQNNAGILFAHLIKEMYKQSYSQIESINGLLKEIENNIFEGQEKEMVNTLSLVNRKLLDFKQSLRFHDEILKSFENISPTVFGKNYSYYASSIIGEYNKIQNAMEINKETLSDLRNANDSLLKSKTNDIMKRLTILSFIMLPISIITNLLVISRESLLIKNNTHLFVLFLSLITLGIFMLYYFKKKKWM